MTMNKSIAIKPSEIQCIATIREKKRAPNINRERATLIIFFYIYFASTEFY